MAEPILPTTYTFEAFEGQEQNPTTGRSTSVVFTPNPYIEGNAPYGKAVCTRAYSSPESKVSYHFKGTINAKDSFFLAQIFSDAYTRKRMVFISSYSQDYRLNLISGNQEAWLRFQFNINEVRYFNTKIISPEIYTPSMMDQTTPYVDGGLKCVLDYSGDTDG